MSLRRKILLLAGFAGVSELAADTLILYHHYQLHHTRCLPREELPRLMLEVCDKDAVNIDCVERKIYLTSDESKKFNLEGLARKFFSIRAFKPELALIRWMSPNHAERESATLESVKRHKFQPAPNTSFDEVESMYRIGPLIVDRRSEDEILFRWKLSDTTGYNYLSIMRPEKKDKEEVDLIHVRFGSIISHMPEEWKWIMGPTKIMHKLYSRILLATAVSNYVDEL
ncbi:uncharacterized protein VTP21DRAFT_10128 [Calcarisporiella thermophila]|uniref:uncharacterized protein n=1 Tax=Calcarisporiella thermophila TaxID=911321 RepID=UPI00374260DF